MYKQLSALLLRLYPPDFRREYGESFLQLCQDRWRDETGVLRRFRLVCDLIADSIAGTPRAWWVHEPQRLAPIGIVQPDGIPTFRMFERRSLHPGLIAFGAVLSLSALSALMFVVSHARVPPPPRAGSSAQSPIESVMQRINRPVNSGLGTTEDAPQNSAGIKRAAQPTPDAPGTDEPRHPALQTSSERVPVVAWPDRQSAKSGIELNPAAALANCTLSSADVDANTRHASQAAKGRYGAAEKDTPRAPDCVLSRPCSETNAMPLAPTGSPDPRPCPWSSPPGSKQSPAPSPRTPARTRTRSHSPTRQ